LSSRLRRHVTFANTCALLALVLAIAGSSTASALVVTGEDVKNGSLTGLDIKDSSLTGTDIRSASITGSDMKTQSLTVNHLNSTALGTLTQHQYWDQIPSGRTVTGAWGYDGSGSTGDYQITVNLPGTTASNLTGSKVNMAPSVTATDDDAECSGSYAAPTAPAGKVCVYLWTAESDTTAMQASQANQMPNRAFIISWNDTALGSTDVYATGTWAYTQP
jgi:hypothetical protein